MPAGRYAPSPTSDLHVGNLRTAMVAWLLSRSRGESFHLRIEDLDTARVRAAGEVARRQVEDLEALGLDWDGPIVVQSERLELYAEAVSRLDTYPCFCTRREIAEAASAPHGSTAHYPGTCRDLAADVVAQRAAKRPGALRMRADGASCTITDIWAGAVTAEVDDLVVRRNDGVFAYNLASVVDDGLMGITTVCRGRDLLASSPSQVWLAGRLGFAPPTYAHVGLVTNAEGARLAKRDGAVTLRDLRAEGTSAAAVRGMLAVSLGLAAPGDHPDMTTLLGRFDPSSVDVGEWVY